MHPRSPKYRAVADLISSYLHVPLLYVYSVLLLNSKVWFLHIWCLHSSVQYNMAYIFWLGPSWSWSYVSWIYNYLCNQCLLPLTLWVWIPLIIRWKISFPCTNNITICCILWPLVWKQVWLQYPKSISTFIQCQGSLRSKFREGSIN
jgi:hypothetical protein